MIKVIQKAFHVLQNISENNQVSVKELAEKTGMKVTTLCNILTTLVKIGCLQKEDGTYYLGRNLFDLVLPHILNTSLLYLAEEYGGQLSRGVQEGVVISYLYKGEKYNLCRIEPDREIRANTDRFAFYKNSQVRVLLAYLTEEQLNHVLQTKGMPGDEWPEVKTFEELKAALIKIRKEKIAFKTTREFDVHSVAVPVFGSLPDPVVSIGVFVPAMRFHGEHQRDIVARLKDTAESMGFALRNLSNV